MAEKERDILVCLPARNEGENVAKTIEWWRGSKAPSTRLRFCVVDDCSDDNYFDLRSEDTFVFRSEVHLSQALCRDAAAIKMMGGSPEAWPDCLVWMDAHVDGWREEDCARLKQCDVRVEEPLEALADIVEKMGGIVCPLCTNQERETDFVGSGGRIVWAPQKGDHKRGPGLRINWDYPRLHGRDEGSLFRVMTPYGGCYAMSPRTFIEVGGFLDVLGCYGFAEESLGIRAHLLNIPCWCYKVVGVRHFFRSGRPYDANGTGYWRNFALTVKLCFPRTFEKVFLPTIRAFCSDPLVDAIVRLPLRWDREPVVSEEETLEWLGILEGEEVGHED